MINNEKKFFSHFKLLGFNIIRGIIIMFITAVVAIIAVKCMGHIIDWDVFFTFKYMYKVMIGGGVIGITAWWIKIFGSGNNRKK